MLLALRRETEPRMRIVAQRRTAAASLSSPPSTLPDLDHRYTNSARTCLCTPVPSSYRLHGLAIEYLRWLVWTFLTRDTKMRFLLSRSVRALAMRSNSGLARPYDSVLATMTTSLFENCSEVGRNLYKSHYRTFERRISTSHNNHVDLLASYLHVFFVPAVALGSPSLLLPLIVITFVAAFRPFASSCCCKRKNCALDKSYE